jgi:hypothetical protein
MLLNFGWQAFAHEPADGSIYGTLAPYTIRTQPRDHEFSSPWTGGFGLIAEGDLDQHGGIEIGAMYLNQLFSLKQDNLEVEELGHRIYVTTGYRYWPADWFSVALTFFSSYSIGSGQIVHNEFPASQTPETSAHVITSYGFDGSVQFEPWHKDRYAMIVDLRYSYSITPRPGEDSNFYGAMVGLKYFIQSPDVPPPLHK